MSVEQGTAELLTPKSVNYSVDDLPLMMSARHIMQLGFSRATAYQFLNRDDLPVVRIGERLFMHKVLFLEWLEQQAHTGNDEVHV